MKRRLFITAILAAALSACDFLDVVPNGTATEEDLFSSSLECERYLNSVYGYMPLTMAFRNSPDLCAGGDLISGANGLPRYYPYKGLLYGEENSNNTYFGFWEPTAPGNDGKITAPLAKGIRSAWDILDNVDFVPDFTDENRSSVRGEAYFLIGYYHWLLMEYYGPVVIVDRKMPVDADEDEILLPRSDWDACTDFVCAMFDSAAVYLPTSRTATETGRATAQAAKALKARVLMYAASPLVNGNAAFADFKSYDGTPLIPQTYDAEKWRIARDATLEAIEFAEAHGHRLFEDPAGAGWSDAERGRNNYYQCFLQRWNSQEYIFASANQTSAQQLQQYGAPRQWDASKSSYTSYGFKGYLMPTQQAVENFLTDKGLPLWADPDTKDGYEANRLLTVAAGDSTALLFRHRDPRFYATVGYDRGRYIYNGDTVSLHMRCKERHGYTNSVKHEYNSCTGYVLQKYISISSNYTDVTKSITYHVYSVPLVRLAELYLDYAEADFEYTGTLGAKALSYLDRIHARAGLPRFEDAWAQAGGIPTGETLRKVLHQENMAELACEGRQYHNIRRWNLAGQVLGGQQDALDITGQTAADFYRIVPMREYSTRVFVSPWLAIPMSELDINYKLVQNPGY